MNHDIPLGFTCPYCTHGETWVVGRRVRAFGRGWLILKLKCGSCSRTWHGRMFLFWVHKARCEDPDLDDAAAEHCLDEGGLVCPRCQGENLQIPTDIGCFTTVGAEQATVGIALWCVCLECCSDYLATYLLGEVLKDWNVYRWPQAN